MDQSEYQREAMRKYMEELSTHTTKIVEKPPQTELIALQKNTAHS